MTTRAATMHRSTPTAQIQGFAGFAKRCFDLGGLMDAAPTSPMNVIQTYVLRGVWTIAGISLGLNSFLVKDKVAEISSTLTILSKAMQTIQIDYAVINKQVEWNTAQLKIHHDEINDIKRELATIKARVRATN